MHFEFGHGTDAKHDLELLTKLGEMLDTPTAHGSVGSDLAKGLLRVRDRSGRDVPLEPNRVQLEYERQRGLRNIVLKARQMHLGGATVLAGRYRRVERRLF